MHLPSLLPLLLVGYSLAKHVGRQFDPKNEDAFENSYGPYPFRSYYSTDLTSPAVRNAYDSAQCHDDNLIFLAPRGFRIQQPAVTILDNDGELVWSLPVKGEPYGLKVQEYNGEKVLTFWVGDDAVGGHGEGWFYLYNTKYEEIAKIRGVNNLRADLHELTITPQGTALMVYYQIYPLVQPGFFKLKDTVYIWDCLFQEFDIATQSLIFEWRASEHHQLNESSQLIAGDGFTPEHPYDWFHINSVEKDELSNYLISARFTSTITYINGTDGSVIWILGGKRNQFQDLSNGQATNMQYQHLARFHPLTAFPSLLWKSIETHRLEKHKHGTTKQLLTAFDNGVQGRPSRGILLELTYPTIPDPTAAYTARLVQAYEHPSHIASVSQGSLQLVPTSNTTDPRVLLGYGHVGVWSEFTSSGTLLCDSHISPQKTWGKGYVQSYTALKHPWEGDPTYPPNMTLSATHESVFISWNGATKVKGWQLQIQNPETEKEDWINIASSQKTGFETEIKLPLAYRNVRFVRLLALDVEGKTMSSFEDMDLWARKSKSKSRITGLVPVNTPISVVVGVVGLILLVLGVRKVLKDRAALAGYRKMRTH